MNIVCNPFTFTILANLFPDINHKFTNGFFKNGVIDLCHAPGDVLSVGLLPALLLKI